MFTHVNLQNCIQDKFVCINVHKAKNLCGA